MTPDRPPTIATAILLLLLVSLGNLALPIVARGGTPPGPVLIAAVVLGIAGLIAAAGLWLRRRWALPLTVIVSVLTGLAAAPGLLFAPSAALVASSAVTVVGVAAIVVLVVLPGSRRAYA